MMKKLISHLTMLLLIAGCAFAFPPTSNATTELNQDIESLATDELSSTIMGINDSTDIEKILDYFYAPAYEKDEVIDVSDDQDLTKPLNSPGTDARLISERSSTKKTGYAQKAWGYVNLLYADGKITGYYVLDIKVYGNNSGKRYAATVSPASYRTHKWGNF